MINNILNRITLNDETVILTPIGIEQPHWTSRQINIYHENGEYGIFFNELYENGKTTETFKDLHDILEKMNLFDDFDVDSNTALLEEWSGYVNKEEVTKILSQLDLSKYEIGFNKI